MRPYVEELAGLTPLRTSCYPNAGLPNEFGGYDETPEEMAATLGEFAASGWLNIVGGCCGTTPRRTSGPLPRRWRGKPPRLRPVPDPLHTVEWPGGPDAAPRNLLHDDRRADQCGRLPGIRPLVREGNLEEAVRVARQQVEGGANVLDINLDDGLLDGETMMPPSSTSWPRSPTWPACP